MFRDSRPEYFVTQCANDRGVLSSGSMPATRVFQGASGCPGRTVSRFYLRPGSFARNLHSSLIPLVAPDKFESKCFSSRLINLNFVTPCEEIGLELYAKCKRSFLAILQKSSRLEK